VLTHSHALMGQLETPRLFILLTNNLLLCVCVCVCVWPWRWTAWAARQTRACWTCCSPTTGSPHTCTASSLPSSSAAPRAACPCHARFHTSAPFQVLRSPNQLSAFTPPSCLPNAHRELCADDGVSHNTSHPSGRCTKFLALDKCLPRRDFLQLVDVPGSAASSGPPTFEYDEEWLAIMRANHTHLSLRKTPVALPGMASPAAMTAAVQAERIWVRHRRLRHELGWHRESAALEVLCSRKPADRHCERTAGPPSSRLNRSKTSDFCEDGAPSLSPLGSYSRACRAR
jgi:hypothetical protein